MSYQYNIPQSHCAPISKMKKNLTNMINTKTEIFFKSIFIKDDKNGSHSFQIQSTKIYK